MKDSSLQALLPPSKLKKSPVLPVRFVWGITPPGLEKPGLEPGQAVVLWCSSL